MADMLTEKAIADSCWCPILWEEKEGASKRVKPGRDWDPMENIQKALALGARNKTVFIEELGSGRKAVPYGDDFWIHVETLEGNLLVTIKEAILDPHYGNDMILTIKRKPRYDPRVSEHEIAEKYLQILIIRHARKWFPSVSRIRIQTIYPKVKDVETEDPNRDQVGEALQWASELFGMWDGSRTLVSRIDRCRGCWWKACSSRDERSPEPVLKAPVGKNRFRGVLD